MDVYIPAEEAEEEEEVAAVAVEEAASQIVTVEALRTIGGITCSHFFMEQEIFDCNFYLSFQSKPTSDAY